MKRKVIQIAGSTQLLSLPRKWALKNHVNKGDELEVVEAEDHLVIKRDSHGKSLEKRGELRFTNAQSFLKRSLSMLYKLGYTEVQIHYTDAEVVRLIYDFVPELLGFEVVSQTQNTCVVKNVAEPVDTEFDTIFRRLFLTVLSVAKETHTAIVTKKYEILKHTQTLERTTNKLTFFRERLLNTKGYHDKEKTCFIYYTTCRLETIGDLVLKIAETVSREFAAAKSVHIASETLSLFEQVNVLFERFYDLFYKYEVGRLVDFKKEQLHVDSHGLELLGHSKGLDTKVTHYLLDVNEALREMTEFLWSKENNRV